MPPGSSWAAGLNFSPRILSGADIPGPGVRTTVGSRARGNPLAIFTGSSGKQGCQGWRCMRCDDGPPVLVGGLAGELSKEPHEPPLHSSLAVSLRARVRRPSTLPSGDILGAAGWHGRLGPWHSRARTNSVSISLCDPTLAFPGRLSMRRTSSRSSSLPPARCLHRTKRGLPRRQQPASRRDRHQARPAPGQASQSTWTRALQTAKFSVTPERSTSRLGTSCDIRTATTSAISSAHR